MLEDPSFSAIAKTELPASTDIVEIDPEARAVVESALEVARERLGMDIGWLAEFRDDRKVFAVLEGDKAGWGLEDGDSLELAESYCQRMYAGRIPNAIPDTRQEPEVADLDVTHRLRIVAYLGVPLVFPDGRLRGAFCCARRTPHPQLDDRDVRFMQVLARLVADELAYRETLRAARRLEQENAAIDALVAALQARDDYTAEHSGEVVELARAIARRLELSEEEVRDVATVALLHDIGKVGIPDSILRKRGPLDDDEWEKMREHPAIGAAVIAGVAGLAHLAPAIRAEHERWDGGGYPDGLAGEAIPIASRITLVADAYHAMISERPYRRSLGVEAARAELRRCAGTMFWPDAVDALLADREG